MDQFLDQLRQSLAASLSADATLRRQAEEFIQGAQRQEGYATALLTICSDGSLD